VSLQPIVTGAQFQLLYDQCLIRDLQTTMAIEWVLSQTAIGDGKMQCNAETGMSLAAGSEFAADDNIGKRLPLPKIGQSQALQSRAYLKSL
jgi:hypothetical protein